LAWIPQTASEYITRTGDAAAPAMQPDQRSLLGVRFDDIFVNVLALVCPTTIDRAGEASRAV
jgi:hypothetical protein